MSAEATQERGRTGVMQAKALLERLLNVHLPFTAYDFQEKCEFAAEQGTPLAGKSYRFDMKGILQSPQRKGASSAGDVYVEVKNYAAGADLLTAYKGFLEWAAYVGNLPDHKTTWFIFLSTAPFGTTRGEELCDGTLLKEVVERWPVEHRPQISALSERIVNVIATPSFSKLIREWGRQPEQRHEP